MNSKLQNDVMKIWDEVSRIENENKALKEENEALKIRSGNLKKNEWTIEFRAIDPCESSDCIMKNGKVWMVLEKTDFGNIYNPEGIIKSLLKELNKL